MKEILILLIGASIALFSTWVKSWIDRESHCSNELFNQRLSYLNKLWISFYEVKTVYDTKSGLGHSNWLKKHKDEALNKLNIFRRCVDEGQVILSNKIINEFIKLDIYLLTLLSEEKQNPSEYISELNVILDRVSTTINSEMNKRVHKIELHLNR